MQLSTIGFEDGIVIRDMLAWAAGEGGDPASPSATFFTALVSVMRLSVVM